MVQGRGFYVGLSFWPGGTIDDWGPVLNETTQQLGLQPCLNATAYTNATNITHQDYLVSAAFDASYDRLHTECTTGDCACVQIQKGVAFSTYEVRVDRMTVLRGNTTEQAALLASAANATRVVSMVAFR